MEERIENRGLTRGGLIKVGAAAALVVGAGGAGRALAGAGAASLAGSGLGKPQGGAAYLHRETFVPLVGSDFRVLRPGERALRVKLIEAKQLPSHGESFSLLFRGRAHTAVGGDIYRIEHPALGEFELFVGPVGRGVKGQDLEAVINRIAT
jgi:hypothetical protein